MATTDEKILRTLRAQAWERAKGEMQAMLNTFYSDNKESEPGQFDKLSKRVDAFVKDIEDDGLQE